jgi:NAD(P)-dependent dehydrogenase (short-subunit alcohol dehydrogenase family)
MNRKRTALVTGASSGIGAATALLLAEAGWEVFAGVRSIESAPNQVGITPVQLDVSNSDSIIKAIALITRHLGEQGLDALVNNAGVGLVAPMEFVEQDDIRKVFEVNVFGLITLTQAALPLLRKARGRIVNLSSVGGLITIPFGGVLCATKHAVEAISDAFRLELRQAGVDVIAIRPGAIHSPAADKLTAESEAMLARLPEEGRKEYEMHIRRFVARMREDENRGSNPKIVAQAIQEALETTEPKAHYTVGKNSSLLEFLARWTPDKVRDHLLLKNLGLPEGPGEM